MRPCCILAAALIFPATLACAAEAAGTRPGSTAPSPVTSIRSVTLSRTHPAREIVTPFRLPKADGTPSDKSIKLALTSREYIVHITQSVGEAIVFHNKPFMMCYTFTSLDPKTDFQWSVWSMHAPFGGVELHADAGGRAYVSWVNLSAVCMAQVTEPRDPLVALTATLAHGGVPGARMVPVRELIPESSNWGHNALYYEIAVISIAPTDASAPRPSDFTITIASPKDQRYKLTSTAGKWRVAP